MTRALSRPSQLAFVTPEYAPLAQTGGLGDAVAGLARALGGRGHRVDCLLPGYRSVREHPGCPSLVAAGSVELALPGGRVAGRWLVGERDDVRLHVLDIAELFGRPSLYGEPAEALRFIAFARASAARARELEPDVLVAHDWPAALSIAVLRTIHDTGPGRGIGTVQVVHNGAHLGRYGAEAMAMTGLPGELFRPDGLEFHGDVCLLKGGLAWADRIVAVSPTYARELQTEAFGGGLEGLYRYRSSRLVGIANGIDTERYDPAADAALPIGFDRENVAPRSRCRRALLEEHGLLPCPEGRLLGAVGRLSDQKGWDVIVAAAPDLIERGFSLVCLGSGDAALAARVRDLAARLPGHVAFLEAWDDGAARRIYAGADAILVPSRFEPCGLVQLLAQRYGALPIAHAVGGLSDTIRDGATGVLFSRLSPEGLVEAAERGAALLDSGATRLRRALLSVPVSWEEPARRWESILAEVASEARVRL